MKITTRDYIDDDDNDADDNIDYWPDFISWKRRR